MELFLQQLTNALALGGAYALLALGLALVFGILGFLNFAHGDLLTITGYAMVGTVALGLPFLMAAVLGVAAAVIAAVLMERIAFRPVRGADATTGLITSFALAVVLHVLFQNLISARPKGLVVPDALTGTLSVGGLEIGTIQALSIAISVVAFFALTWLLRSTNVGLDIRAAAEDFMTLRLMGVRANQVIVSTFIISGVLAGIAGVLYVAQRGSVDPLMGLVPVLKGFIAVVVGGMGSLAGAVAGGLLLGLLEGLLQAYLPAELVSFRDAIVLSILMAVLVARPRGLFAPAAAERA